MVSVRKARAGSAGGRTPQGAPWSFEWRQDGAVVDVPHDVAVELLSIADADYEVVEDSTPQEITEPEAPAVNEVAEPGTDDGEPEIDENDYPVTEPAPVVNEVAEAPAPGKPARGGRTRKTGAE